METIGTAEPPNPVVKFRCPACNRKFATKAALAGKKIRCNRCGAGVRVPERDPVYWSADDPTAAPESSRSRSLQGIAPTPSATHGVPTLPQPPRGRLAEVAPANDARTATIPPQPSRSQRPEPAVPRAMVADAAAEPAPALEELASLHGIKVPRRAGTVLPSRAEVMEQVRQQAAEQTAAAQEQAEIVKKKKKKRRKKAGYFDARETLKLVAGVGALVGVLSLLAWGYPDLRFPLGGLLCVLGFIVYLLGMTSLRQLVAEEGVFKALLFRFCPPYQWWFVATRWEETKDFVAFFGAGMLILSIGGAIIKTSEVGKRAAAADRAYEKAKQGNRPELTPPIPAVGRRQADVRRDGPTSPPEPPAAVDD
jgi:DNA-directed RNA polymerase subunit RPC12/RpoP